MFVYVSKAVEVRPSRTSQRHLEQIDQSSTQLPGHHDMDVDTLALIMSDRSSSSLQGLALSRSERVIILGLSYAWCTPLFFWFGGRLWHYVTALLRRPQQQQQQQQPPPPPPPADNINNNNNHNNNNIIIDNNIPGIN